jgi:hypothetical protein
MDWASEDEYLYHLRKETWSLNMIKKGKLLGFNQGIQFSDTIQMFFPIDYLRGVRKFKEFIYIAFAPLSW